jgi:hypothetical protein
MKKFQTEILIEAPAEHVWKLLMDFQNYWHWNTHLPYWEGKPKAGNHLYITSFLKEKPVRFSAQVTDLIENQLFAFAEIVANPVFFRADHTIEIHPVTPNSCRIVQKECLQGLLVNIVWKKWLLKARQCYGQMNRDLKRFAETQQKQISYLNVG